MARVCFRALEIDTRQAQIHHHIARAHNSQRKLHYNLVTDFSVSASASVVVSAAFRLAQIN